MQRSDSLSAQRETAHASRNTSEYLSALLQRADDAEAREQRMLWWAKVSGVAAIAAAVLALVAVVVTLIVA